VHIRYIWQGNRQIYGHIRCIYTVLSNPMYVGCGGCLLCLQTMFLGRYYCFLHVPKCMCVHMCVHAHVCVLQVARSVCYPSTLAGLLCMYITVKSRDKCIRAQQTVNCTNLFVCCKQSCKCPMCGQKKGLPC